MTFDSNTELLTRAEALKQAVKLVHRKANGYGALDIVHIARQFENYLKGENKD